MRPDELPGFELAQQHGYELHSYQADGSSAFYVKDGLALKVLKSGICELSANVMTVSMTSNQFRPGQGRFELFERHLKTAHDAAYAAFMQGDIHHPPSP